MKLLHEYMNGNVHVQLYDDGTRIMRTEDDVMKLDVPVQCDIKISNFCVYGCPMCHEQSNMNGKHAPLSNFAFLDSWQAGCEAALGGGMVTSYPYLDKLLHMLKDKGIVANITVHQDELINNFNMIKQYQEQGLVNGIGVSLHKPSDMLAGSVNGLNNVVFHVINGLFTREQYEWICKNIVRPKLLILGYKQYGRGVDYYGINSHDVKNKQAWLYNELVDLIKKIVVVSFDNLALEQLNVKRLVNEVEWAVFYQGDESDISMYIDAVEGTFSASSICPIRKPISDDIHSMFMKAKDIWKEYKGGYDVQF